VLNPAEAYDMRVRLEKGFQGVGLGFKQAKDGSLVVTKLIEGGPAATEGSIEVDDRLVEVNGKNVDKMPIDKVMPLLRGNVGSSVKLVFKRGSKSVPVELKRAAIAITQDRVETAYENVDGGVVGKITLHSFYQGANGVNSENDVRKAIAELAQKGPIKGLILDLRENSGGFLTQAVKVAGLFITNGVIAVSKYSNGEEHIYRDMNSSVSYNGPLVILTSKATASAAEIVAQALQDYGVALVVGDEHTYGKGTIQSQTVTDDKSTSYFKVTVGKYYTVSGKTPQIKGVRADIIIPSPFVDGHIGEEYLEYALEADTISPTFDDKLADIDSNLKPWYLHYYTPTLQHPIDKWRSMLPSLRQSADQRLSRNDLYQQFVASEKSNTAEADKIRKRYWVDDVQMQEAVSIIKDMLALQGKDRRNESSTADGAIGAPPR
jgi:carboxyl-terminal processing protease